jgi:hypothetical protein
MVTFTIAVSTLAAGLLADTLPPRVAVWTMVGLIALAGSAWVVFSRPAWHAPPPRISHPADGR